MIQQKHALFVIAFNFEYAYMIHIHFFIVNSFLLLLSY